MKIWRKKRKYWNPDLVISKKLAVSVVAFFSIGTVLWISILVLDLNRLHYAELESSQLVPHTMVQRKYRVRLPDEVRGIYWTAYTAGTVSRREKLLDYMERYDLNTVVIDVKTDDGAIAFYPFNPDLDPYVGTYPAISDLEDLLEQLGKLRIYRIARIAVMKDDVFAEANPDIALKYSSGNLWQDSLGSLWLDPAAFEIADYAIALGDEAWQQGFDEIQYDYVRFPSDGSLGSIVYPVYQEDQSKVVVMEEFFKRIRTGLKRPLSFDLFGMTFVSNDDFGIGQRLLEAYTYADFISPMVYPSHYSSNFRGHANPATAPYDVVYSSLEDGIAILQTERGINPAESRPKIRPWLQDFDLGAIYTGDMIEAQIQATRDAGASGWLLWNARNSYEPADYLATSD